jgi:hypothetical protein
MLLVHKLQVLLQAMLVEQTIVPPWLLQVLVHASLVVNLATSRESALTVFMEFHSQLSLPSLQLLVVVV